MAHDFTLQPGVPLIKASATCSNGRTTVALEQGKVHRGSSRTRRRCAGGCRSRCAAATAPWPGLVDGQASVELPGCGPVLVNDGQKGYFRTLYAPAQFKALGDGAGLPWSTSWA